MLKICTIKTGETLGSDRIFVEDLKNKVPLTEVHQWGECDVILKFCAVPSRPGPEIKSALENIPVDKPAALVVMHHNCDQNCVVHDTNTYQTQPDVIIVNCLFHEQMGLFRCQANDEALEKTLAHVKKYQKRTPPPQPQVKLMCIPPVSVEPTPVPDLDKEKTPPQPQDKPMCIPHDSVEHTPVPSMKEETSKESLREKIKEISPTAEESLRDAGLTDGEILTLTLPDIFELLPGIKNFKKRREIMALIEQQSSQREEPDQDQEPKELDEEQEASGDSSSGCKWTSRDGLREKISKISLTAGENLCVAGLSDAQILTLTMPEVSELLPGILYFKKRREIMDLIKQHTSQTEELPPTQPQHKLEPSSVPDANVEEPSSVPDANVETSSNSLWEKISKISPEAARDLQDAGLSYTQICDLTLPQLEELLPEIKYLRIRRKIKDLIVKYCETSSLREKISCISQTVAKEWQDNDFSDEEICTFTPTELQSLFPGLRNFLNRRDIMSLIRQHSKAPGAQLGHREPPKMPERQQQNTLDANQLQEEPVAENAEGEEMPSKPLPDGNKGPESAKENEQASKPKLFPKILQCSSVDAFPAQPPKMATGFSSVSPIYAQRPVNVHVLGDSQITHILVQQLMCYWSSMDPWRSWIIPSSLEQCRVVLLVYTATSLKGEEIKAALRGIPDSKDTILVVGQQSPPCSLETCQIEDINGKNIKETFDFFFYANTEQTGFTVNEHSISRLQNVLQKYG